MNKDAIELSPSPTKKNEIMCWYCGEMKKYPDEFPIPHYPMCGECGKKEN